MEINQELLQKTFATLQENTDRWQESDFDRIQGIYDLLQGRISQQEIQRAYTIVNAEYNILPNRSIEKLVQRVNVHFGDFGEDIAGKILGWVIFGVEDALEKTDDDLLTRQIKLNHGLATDADMGDEIKHASGAFGYTATNPIPLNGIDNINNYFEKLRLITGESFAFKRIGREDPETLPFPVDVYEISNAETEVVATLYVYAYHGQNSAKVPEGFKMLGD
jgi:hypothetical protein